jgi:beta-phosphoglucomutase-like phosphatase (HAD superfamily)
MTAAAEAREQVERFRAAYGANQYVKGMLDMLDVLEGKPLPMTLWSLLQQSRWCSGS